MTDDTLFDDQFRWTPQAAAEEAIQRVDANANREWRDAAWFRLRGLAQLEEFFTSDDVWGCLDVKGVTTHEPRAMGAIIKRAVRGGVIVGTDRWVPSVRVECHGRPVRVWRAR